MPDQADVDAINDAITENAQQPARVKFGNREVEQHSLADQIEAAEHIASQASAANGGAKVGLRFTRLVPPGGG